MSVIATDSQPKHCNVYWIHLPEHTDIFSQGYIGITTKSVNKRFVEHRCAAKNGSNLVIHNAIRKYGDNIVYDLILVGDLDYCTDLEKKLRPEFRIGWNLAVGGSKTMLGFKHSDETKRKISEYFKGRPLSDEHKEKVKNTFLGRHHTEETKQILREKAKIRGVSDATRKAATEANKKIPPWNKANSDKSVWESADIFYEDFINGSVSSPHFMGKKYSISGSKFVVMWRKFQNGWNPLNDHDWLKFFNKGLNK